MVLVGPRQLRWSIIIAKVGAKLVYYAVFIYFEYLKSGNGVQRIFKSSEVLSCKAVELFLSVLTTSITVSCGSFKKANSIS